MVRPEVGIANLKGVTVAIVELVERHVVIRLRAVGGWSTRAIN